MDQEKIGKFIAKMRKEKKLSQKELAEKLKVSKICLIYLYLNLYVKN